MLKTIDGRGITIGFMHLPEEYCKCKIIAWGYGYAIGSGHKFAH